ncbi:MAG: hypothetical protein ABI891_14570 [Acidobacteriota bacterium]
MNKTKILFLITLVCLFGLTNIFAQTQNQPPQAEPSYEVVLHILNASNNSAGKSSVPQSLSNVVKKLKTIYSYSNYSLDSTYLERIANSGVLDFKGVSKKSDQNQENYASVFTDWTFNSLRRLPNEQGKNSIQFESFRFGQRVPIITSVSTDTNGKTNNIINYEQIGLTMKSLSLPENVPTIIGSLSTSKPDELIFLVLTVKPTEQ